MNERIRQLAEQAAKFSAIMALPTGESGDKLFVEKFAELVIQECVGVCESMQLIGPYKEVQDATLKDAVVQIKQHFGVEE